MKKIILFLAAIFSSRALATEAIDVRLYPGLSIEKSAGNNMCTGSSSLWDISFKIQLEDDGYGNLVGHWEKVLSHEAFDRRFDILVEADIEKSADGTYFEVTVRDLKDHYFIVANSIRFNSDEEIRISKGIQTYALLNSSPRPCPNQARMEVVSIHHEVQPRDAQNAILNESVATATCEYTSKQSNRRRGSWCPYSGPYGQDQKLDN